ncbi:hypothetical protein OUZ56_008654 [Daphnia magna]|uniref:Uncharacterized protein n=1 Tax=Daphnia magna TaxID=35525 RepID=A0ABR0ADM8_9CRUS|nr:hypothetical protein OUZ56_008654 [Daphnia magna]
MTHPLRPSDCLSQGPSSATTEGNYIISFYWAANRQSHCISKRISHVISFAGRAYGFRDFYGDQAGPYRELRERSEGP